MSKKEKVSLQTVNLADAFRSDIECAVALLVTIRENAEVFNACLAVFEKQRAARIESERKIKEAEKLAKLHANGTEEILTPN